MLTVDMTGSVYSGKPGCMCGCRGNYKDSERARKMAITSLLKNPDSRLQDFGKEFVNGDAGCLYVETPTRIRVLYLTKEGVEAAREMLELDPA